METKETIARRYTCKEVAQCYGVTYRTVHEWIKSGQLHAVHIGRRYYVTADDLLAMERAARA